jgi:hypothetical protein
MAISATEWIQRDILDLTERDRAAVLDWLRTGSRHALYARHATDSEIGRRSPESVGPAPTPTPNPYRQLEFGTPTLGGEPMAKIAVLGGWVAVKRDGRRAEACISFKNAASVTATRVLFEFPLSDQSGVEVGALKLDRRGTFSPGIDIRSWPDMASWQQYNHRGYAENCTNTELGVAAFPLLKAHYATYRILRVEYANGTSWVP